MITIWLVGVVFKTGLYGVVLMLGGKICIPWRFGQVLNLVRKKYLTVARWPEGYYSGIWGSGRPDIQGDYGARAPSTRSLISLIIVWEDF